MLRSLGSGRAAAPSEVSPPPKRRTPRLTPARGPVTHAPGTPAPPKHGESGTRTTAKARDRPRTTDADAAADSPPPRPPGPGHLRPRVCAFGRRQPARCPVPSDPVALTKQVQAA